MTEQIPPTIFTDLISSLLNFKIFMDEGNVIGIINGLNVEGISIQAGVSGEYGTILVNADQDLTQTMSTVGLKGDFAPSTPDFTTLEQATVNIEQGDISYAAGRITFNKAATWKLAGSVSSIWPDLCTPTYTSGVYSFTLRIWLYNSAGVLQDIINSTYFTQVYCTDGNNSFANINTLETLNSGDYAIIGLGVNSSIASKPTPTSVAYNFSVLELRNYV